MGFEPDEYETSAEIGSINFKTATPAASITKDAIKLFVEKSSGDDKKNYLQFPYTVGELNYNFKQPEITPGIFTSSNVYIYKPLHEVVGVTDDESKPIIGEMVIEHENASRQKMYVCAFLQNSGTTADTVIDKLVNLKKTAGTGSITTDVYALIPNKNTSNETILYKDIKNGHWVVLILNPIVIDKETVKYIDQNFDLASTTNFFSIDPPNQLFKIDGSQVVVGEDDQIYIDCNPTDPLTGREIDEVGTYNIPINSEYTKQMRNIDFMKTTVNFFVFMIGIMFAYFMVPALYKKIVIDIINKNYGASGGVSGKKLFAADIFITIIFIFASVLLIKSGDTNSMSIGILLVVVYLMSMPLIQSKKEKKDYMTTIIQERPIIMDKGTEAQWYEIFGLFKDMVASPKLKFILAMFFVLEIIAVLILMLIKIDVKTRDLYLQLTVPLILLFSGMVSLLTQ